MSLTIKAFLYEVSWRGDPSEIRRFTVDQDVSTSYTYLLEKIAQVFPSLQTTNVVVAWMDTDGDLIVISSDEELVQALDQFEGNIFRLYLKKRSTQGSVPSTSAFSGPPREPKPILESDDEDDETKKSKTEPQTQQQGEPTGQEQGPLHPNVQCDGCQGPVRGTRYKCLVCRDYDLCSGCEAKGIHVEHNMVSITEPCSYNPWGGFGGNWGGFGGNWGGRGRCWGRGGGHPCRGRWGHHGAHHGGPPHGWCGQQQQPHPSFCGGGAPSWCGGQQQGAPSYPPWAPWVFGHPYFPRGGCHGGGGRRGGRRCGKPEATTAAGKEGEAQQQPTTSAPGTESMETDQTPGPSEEERKTFLHGVGEAVSSFLEPFGIKVDVDVAGGENQQQTTEGDPAATDTSEQPTAPPEAGSDVIEQAVAQLGTMGYDDEGGWLTELVRAKGGDISKVLDALHPSTSD